MHLNFISDRMDNVTTMTIEEAIDQIEEGLLSLNAVSVKIRSAKTIDRELYGQPIRAIQFLIENFNNESVIPKRLALCFVDISNAFFVSDEHFSIEEVEEIEDMGIELVALGNELFS